jgi:putative phosphoesterase
MKIGILADSHDNLPKIARAVEIFNAEGVGRVLHAGDFVSPITAGPFTGLNAPLVGVFGNNDGDRLYLTERFREIGTLHTGTYEWELGGVRGVLMHEPRSLDALIKSGHYDLIVYGHTHEIDVREGKTLIVNPGECGGWLTGRATIAVLDLEEMDVRILDL